MIQHEIRRARPLLDANGNIAEPGFARRLLPVYSRKAIKAGPLRIKEWDYYLVSNGRFAVALTVADNGYMGMDSVSFLDLENLWQQTVSPMSVMPLGRRAMPESSAAGDVSVSGRGYEISFRHIVGGRKLSFSVDNFYGSLPIRGDIVLTDEPEESIVMCTPFRKKAHFYYNQKINCMRASGSVTVRGRQYSFEPDTAFAVLDWGRGGGGSLRLQYRLRLRRHLGRDRKRALLRREAAQALPRQLQYTAAGRAVRLYEPLDLHQRRQPL